MLSQKTFESKGYCTSLKCLHGLLETKKKISVKLFCGTLLTAVTVCSGIWNFPAKPCANCYAVW